MAGLRGGNTSGGAQVRATVVNCNPDFDVWSLGSRVLWTPVAGLNMGLDVLYHEFESQRVPARLP
jgi:hypothetical protein